MLKKSLFILAFLSVLCASDACAEPWQVIDGDTIRHGESVIRLWGIDAPEISQRCLNEDDVEYKCGQEAKTALKVLIWDKPLMCQFINMDRYKRSVAQCSIDGVDIGGLMVSLGWAVDFKRYSDGYYATEQFQAQKEARGLWKGKFSMPSEYRRNRI